MSNLLSGILVIVAAGSLMAGQPAASTPLGSLPSIPFSLVSGGHGSDSGHSSESGGSDRSGPSERSGRSAEAGDDRGGQGELEVGDDHGGNGEVEAGDDNGVDVNDLPDDSDSQALLVPLAMK